METYTNIQLEQFLDDFEKRTEIIFLEDAKQTSDLFSVAEAKGILAKNSRDLAVFKAVYTFADMPNGNGVTIPEQELLRKLPTVIGKPVTLEHVRRFVIGFIVDYRYIVKDKTAIVYGIIFKNCFAAEWEKALQLFKDHKLAVSSEIWSPKSKREYTSDKEYKINDIEFAGCTLVFIDKKNKPAFADAMVLEVAKKNYSETEELVLASLNKNNLEILSCGKCNNGKACGLCESLIVASQDITPSATVATPTPIVNTQPNKLKIICQHCAHNFEHLFIQGQNNPINCPNCSAILDQAGKVIYPPQIKNFDLSCPDCQARNNWLTEASQDNEAKVKCKACQKEYMLKFKKIPEEYNALLGKIMFLRTGKIPCIQCGTYNNFNVPSSQKKIGIKCKKCDLEFSFDIEDAIKREIESFAEYKDIPIDKEGKPMFILEEAKLEITEEVLNEVEKDEVGEILIEAKKLSYEERQNIEDKDFAVVITVKNKVTGEPRKIRKYPIKDEAHVRNALARLGQDAPRAELQKLGVSPETVIKKVLARARELGMTELLQKRGMEKSKVCKLLRKACSKTRLLQKAKEEEARLHTAKMEKAVKVAKKFAGKIRELQSSNNQKEVELSNAKLEIEKIKTQPLETAKEVKPEVVPEVPAPVLEVAKATIGDKPKDEDHYVAVRNEINAKAFGHLKK